MIIAITADGTVELRDADDFRSFKIVDEAGLRPEALSETLRDVATLNDDATAAWVRRAAVPAFVANGPTTEWYEAYDGMMETADKHGWVRKFDDTVLAHIETKIA